MTRGEHPGIQFWSDKSKRQLKDCYAKLLADVRQGTLDQVWKNIPSQQDATPRTTERDEKATEQGGPEGPHPMMVPAGGGTKAKTVHTSKRRRSPKKQKCRRHQEETLIGTFEKWDILVECPLHPNGGRKQHVKVCREGETVLVPTDTVPKDSLLRSYGHEWKRAHDATNEKLLHTAPEPWRGKRQIPKRAKEHERIHIDTSENNPDEDIEREQH